MKLKLTVIAVITMVAGMVSTSILADNHSMSEEKKKEIAEKMMQAAQPGEEHKLLRNLEGKWTCTSQFWMEPGAKAMSVDWACDAEMILGGRFLHIASVSASKDMPGENLTIFGYDRRFGKFTMVGFDTWGTYFVTSEGEFDPRTRTISFYGEDYDPIAGFTQKWRTEMRIPDNDTFYLDLYFTDDVMSKGQDEFKMASMIYKREK
ncbi:MAG: DUF1579 domain-containing protein [candidate division Zixibacteria bacterium]|nr:DUF1579 domain-containing protein [candidate division Zixibacteria bacterium]